MHYAGIGVTIIPYSMTICLCNMKKVFCFGRLSLYIFKLIKWIVKTMFLVLINTHHTYNLMKRSCLPISPIRWSIQLVYKEKWHTLPINSLYLWVLPSDTKCKTVKAFKKMLTEAFNMQPQKTIIILLLWSNALNLDSDI